VTAVTTAPAEAGRPATLPVALRAAVRGGLAAADPRRLPGWGQALVVLAASRVLFTFVALRAVDLAGWHRDGTHWTYLQIANNWDGTWYQRIAVEGYPAGLPHDSTGAVAPSTWAFYPLYPKLARLAEGLGLSWAAAATTVSVLAAAAAAIGVRAVTAHVAGPRVALWTTALFCFFPSALVLQLPYSEALAMLLLVATLWCLQRGRYLLVVPVLLLVGLARPIGAPLAGVLTIHLLGEARAVRGLPRALAARALAGPLIAWAASVVAAVAWPLLVWWGSGVPDGYTRTMAAWRSPHEIVWLQPWLDAAELYLGRTTGPVALVAGVAGLAWWLARRGLPVLGRDLTAWCACYAAYLLAVLDSFTSLPRYLLPLFPLGTLLVVASGSRAYRIAITSAFAALGVVWMLAVWRSHQWAP